MMAMTLSGAGDRPTQAAAQWWTRLRAEDPSDATIEQWLAWMEEDESHARAFEEVGRLGQRLGQADIHTREAFVAEFAGAAERHVRWPLWIGAVAASLLVAVLGGRMLDRVYRAQPQPYASEVGQNRDLDLPDGTRVALGGASAITASYADDLRKIELKDGEAFFHVTHERRPFEVVAGPVLIRDLGTAFNVRRTGDRVAVAVTEGRVRVSQPGATDALEAAAGQQVLYDPRAGMTIGPIAVEDATAWRGRRLEFVNEPLFVVVASINRYSRRPVQIADPRVGALTFTGTVRVDAIDRWVEALPRVFPVQVSAFGDHVVLSSAQLH
ncbi:FecR domain-containing protein [Dyella marensis]|uniref:FecR family protein n=1 Tax=Dyella marensis TaxID=500610 RepID=A0A1I1X7P9_9GAMM|nr:MULTISPECIES: FecR domain-containing protein [Dyella]SFE03221.1 FecR family protein [Dyella marensis]